MLPTAFSLSTVAFISAVLALVPTSSNGQTGPNVMDRVIPAAVQIAIVGTAVEHGIASETYIPVASGTVISPDGLILTNAHAVDMSAHQDTLRLWEQQAAEVGQPFTFTLDTERLLILGTDGSRP